MVFKMSRLAGGFAGVAALTVACGGVNSDRAGGAANVDPVVLTMAQQLGRSAALAAGSGPTMSPRDPAAACRSSSPTRWRYGEPEFETGTIDDVQAGEVDLA